MPTLKGSRAAGAAAAKAFGWDAERASAKDPIFSAISLADGFELVAVPWFSLLTDGTHRSALSPEAGVRMGVRFVGDEMEARLREEMDASAVRLMRDNPDSVVAMARLVGDGVGKKLAWDIHGPDGLPTLTMRMTRSLSARTHKGEQHVAYALTVDVEHSPGISEVSRSLGGIVGGMIALGQTQSDLYEIVSSIEAAGEPIRLSFAVLGGSLLGESADLEVMEMVSSYHSDFGVWFQPSLDPACFPYEAAVDFVNMEPEDEQDFEAVSSRSSIPSR